MELNPVTLPTIGLEPASIDRDRSWREARIRDPDGSSLCLDHADGNRFNPPWRIGSSEP